MVGLDCDQLKLVLLRYIRFIMEDSARLVSKVHVPCQVSDEFLRAIPKADLHVHLDGSLRLTTLIDIAQKKGIHLPSYDPDTLRGICFNGGFRSLEQYLEGFAYTVSVMQDAESMERIAFEFAEDNFLEGVRYFEVRFAPQLHASIDPEVNFNLEQVIAAVDRGLRKAKDYYNEKLRLEGDPFVPPYDYGIIVCAMRFFRSGMSSYYDALLALHLDEPMERVASIASEILVRCALKCKEVLGYRVVAIDIAGAENGFEATTHKEAFALAHQYLLNKTVHAGEGFGPESIFQAVRDLHAERIGHGFYLFHENMIVLDKNKQDKHFLNRLVKYVCDRRICLEVCLTSNLDTMPTLDLRDHAMKKMLAHGVCVTLNTDNRLVSNTDSVKELRKAIDAFGLSAKQLKEIVINGFKRSFYHGSYVDRRMYVRMAIDYYDALAEKYDVR